MNTLNLLKKLTISLLLANSISLNAQVTIGSSLPPAKGALLDIKTQTPCEANLTSTRGGVLITRVRLVNPTELSPFVANTDPDLAQLKISHVGLLVYNLTENDLFSPGLHIWNGERWVGEQRAQVTANARNGLTLSENQVHLGGELIRDTELNLAGNELRFKTEIEGSWRINEQDLIVFGNNTVAVGTDFVPDNIHFIVGGDTNLDDALTVSETTQLQASTVFRAPFRYNPDGGNPNGLFIRAIDDDGTAVWAMPQFGEISILQGSARATSSDPNVTFPSLTNNSHGGGTNFQYSNQFIYLPPGRWLVMVTVLLRGASTANGQKLWVKLGFSRRNNQIGTAHQAFDMFRDRENAAWPAYIETVLHRAYTFNNVSGNIVIDNTATWRGTHPETDVAFLDAGFFNRTDAGVWQAYTQAHANEGRIAYSRFDLTLIRNTVGLLPGGNASWNWRTAAVQLSNNATENVITAIRLD